MLVPALSLMLALRPTVAVEVEPDPLAEAPDVERAEALRGWLVRRLLEEGYAVASDPAAAHGVVRVRTASDGLVVVAQGHERRTYAVESGPAAVQRLEVLHRALQGVEQTCDASVALPEPEPALAVRFVGGTEDDGLLEAVAAASRDAGITLSTRPQSDDTLACIERRGNLAEVGLGGADDGCGPPRLVFDLGEGSVQTQREVAQQLVAAAIPIDDESPLDLDTLGGPSADELDRRAPPAPAVVAERSDELVPMKGPPRAEMRLGLSGGIVSRGASIDPQFQAGWRLGKIHGLGGRLSTSLIPSSGQAIQVLDARLVVGPDWQLQAGKRGEVSFAALVGTDLHTFSAGTGERTAGDVAFAAELPVTYAFTLRGQTRMQLVLDPGLSSTAWSHNTGLLREGKVAWSRPAWRVGMALGFTHGWRIE